MRFQKLFFAFILFIFSQNGFAQAFDFAKHFQKYNSYFDTILAKKSTYRLQIIYTQIDRNKYNQPTLTTYNFDADKYYHYCASLIKLPAAVLALEKINSLKNVDLSRNDSFTIQWACDDLDPDALMLTSKKTTLAQCIKEMMLVSNNKAFNPVYDFLGQSFFNERMHQLGYKDAVINNRFSGCDTGENRFTNAMRFYGKEKNLKYSQEGIENNFVPFYAGKLSPLVGNAYLGNGMLINHPKDFTFMNYVSLSSVHDLLTKIIFPTTSKQVALKLNPEDHAFLVKTLGMFPRECGYPIFDSLKYPDNYMKYFIHLDSNTTQLPSNLRVFNKVGQAYGFMSDCSYFIDTLNKIEFFLSASMYLNKDEILNDGKYEYDQIGYPFFQNLFNSIYLEELKRTQKFKPVFDKINFADTASIKISAVAETQFVDKTKPLSFIENQLCQLADNMWSDAKLNINYDEVLSDKIFKDNLQSALQLDKSNKYPFLKLKEKNIQITENADGKLRIFSWLSADNKMNDAIFQFTQPDRKITAKTLQDFTLKGSEIPKILYRSIYKIGGKSVVYLVVGNTSEGTGNADYLQSFGMENGKFEKLKNFKYEDNIFSDILVEHPDGKGKIKFDEKNKIVSFPMISMKKNKPVIKTIQLKYNGAFFTTF